MRLRRAFSGGGGGGGGSDKSPAELAAEYVEGTSVRVQALVSLLFGGWLLAWTSNLLLVVGSVVDAAQSILEGIGHGIADLIYAWTGVPEGVVAASWRSAAEFVSGLGPLAFPIAVAITIATLWVFAEGVNRG